MDPKTEHLLMQYLAEGHTEKVEIRDHLKLSSEGMHRIFHQLELHEQKDDARHNETRAALAGLDARVNNLERDVEDTGRHNIEDLRARLKEHKDAGTWWARFGVQTLAGGAGFLIATVVGIVVAVLVKGH